MESSDVKMDHYNLSLVFIYVLVKISCSQANANALHTPETLNEGSASLKDEGALIFTEQVSSSFEGSYVPGTTSIEEKVPYELINVSVKTNPVKGHSLPSKCDLELRTVPLPPLPQDLHIAYRTTGVRLMRCGGFCEPSGDVTHVSSARVCEPTAAEKITVLVQVLGSSAAQWQVTLYNHTECACRCYHKKEHCHDAHVYNPEDCSCSCGDTAAEDECNQTTDKHWDMVTCTCLDHDTATTPQ